MCIYLKMKNYISGKKHKWACRRFLEDIKRSEARNVQNKEFPYIWDKEEAEKIVEWFALLKHSKGDLAGQPIILNPWQKFVLCQIYGWRHKETGRKRLKEVSLRLKKIPKITDGSWSGSI